jgi:hypothetical protein
MRRLLILVGARSGVHRSGQHLGRLESTGDKQEEEKIKENTTTIGVVSVLILTVSFAAAFQLPGGYSTGDNKLAGTPELAFKYSFQAFLVANNLAATCSAMATICLMYASTTAVNIRTRVYNITLSVFLVNSSARSLAAAFAFGTYAVLAPVAREAVIITWVLTGFVLLDIVWLGWTIGMEQLVLLKRRGIAMEQLVSRLVFAFFVSFPFWVLWPYVVIASFIVYLKVHGIH